LDICDFFITSLPLLISFLFSRFLNAKILLIQFFANNANHRKCLAGWCRRAADGRGESVKSWCDRKVKAINFHLCAFFHHRVAAPAGLAHAQLPRRASGAHPFGRRSGSRTQGARSHWPRRLLLICCQGLLHSPAARSLISLAPRAALATPQP
jgi:hypothetical protein